MNQPRSTVWIAILPVASSMLLSGCRSPGAHRRVGPKAEFDPNEIRAMLQIQADAWNAGDIDGFMRPYWRSPELTFSTGGKVTRGWEATYQRYKTRYPDRAAMGRLTFSDLDIDPLGDEAALVLGRWRLEREKPVGGNFTLVLRRSDGKWLIVHDHTSADEP